MSKRTNIEIKAAIEANAQKWFKAMSEEDFTAAAKVEKTMAEDKAIYDSQSRAALLAKYDTLLDFLKNPSYDTITWRPVKDKDTLIGVDVQIKPKDLTIEDVTKKVKPAQSNWWAYVEQLQLQLSLRAAEVIGYSVQELKEIEETLYMRKGGRSVVVGPLDSNAKIDKAIKLAIRALTNEVTEEQVEEAIKSYDRNYMLLTFGQRASKGKLRTLNTSKVANILFMDVMGAHWADRPYTLVYKKDTELAKARQVNTVQNPNPNSKSESKTETQSAKSKPSAKGKGGKRITKKDKGGDVAAA